MGDYFYLINPLKTSLFTELYAMGFFFPKIPIFKECWFVSKKQQPQPTNKHTKPPHTLVKTAIKRVS